MEEKLFMHNNGAGEVHNTGDAQLQLCMQAGPQDSGLNVIGNQVRSFRVPKTTIWNIALGQ
jgi:hypothetical protein